MSNVQIKRTPSSVEYSSLQKFVTFTNLLYIKLKACICKSIIKSIIQFLLFRNFDSHGGKQIYLSSTNAITSDENNDNNVPIKNTPLSTGYSNLQKFVTFINLYIKLKHVSVSQ